VLRRGHPERQPPHVGERGPRPDAAARIRDVRVTAGPQASFAWVLHLGAALLSALALAAAVPLGRRLSRRSDERMEAVESFAGGVGLAYVLVDLLVEL